MKDQKEWKGDWEERLNGNLKKNDEGNLINLDFVPKNEGYLT